MGRRIKDFSDGSFLEYDRGKIDSWCVYMIDPDGVRRPPLDRDYFNELKALADKYGVERVYSDFVSIYDSTTRNIDVNVLEDISQMAAQYDDSLDVDKLFTTFYMAMTSEENYPNTRLGRKIKRLAAYEILFGGRDVDNAVVFMKRMGWREIDALCRERGF